MICLRCGYCCIKYVVVIISKDLGEKSLEIEENYEEKKSDVRCKHLIGCEPGKLNCSVHNLSWYKETPCYQHTQIGRQNSNCRIGEHLLKDPNWSKNLLLH